MQCMANSYGRFGPTVSIRSPPSSSECLAKSMNITYDSRASTAGHYIFSFNISDYRRIHTAWINAGKSHYGIILAPQKRYSVGEQVRRLVRLTTMKSAEDMRDSV